MYNPLPVFDYSFNMLPWRTRLRRNLMEIKEDQLEDELKDPKFYDIRESLDADLDLSLWHPNAKESFRCLKQKLDLFSVCARTGDDDDCNRKRNKVKLALMKIAMDKAFAGVKKRCQIGNWKMYMLSAFLVKERNYRSVTFTSEDMDLAFDWLLEAVLSQQEEIVDEFRWNVYRLYRVPYNNPNKKVDITDAFWAHAYPLAEDPMKQF